MALLISWVMVKEHSLEYTGPYSVHPNVQPQAQDSNDCGIILVETCINDIFSPRRKSIGGSETRQRLASALLQQDLEYATKRIETPLKISSSIQCFWCIDRGELEQYDWCSNIGADVTYGQEMPQKLALWDLQPSGIFGSHNGFVCDIGVNDCLTLLKQHDIKTYYVSSHFYVALSSDLENQDEEFSASARFFKGFEEQNYVFIPINAQKLHWYGFRVCIERHDNSMTFVLVDGLPNLPVEPSREHNVAHLKTFLTWMLRQRKNEGSKGLKGISLFLIVLSCLWLALAKRPELFSRSIYLSIYLSQV